jgi:hypothetical protein
MKRHKLIMVNTITSIRIDNKLVSIEWPINKTTIKLDQIISVTTISNSLEIKIISQNKQTTTTMPPNRLCIRITCNLPIMILDQFNMKANMISSIFGTKAIS